jgi:hypothetical protein
MPEHSCGTTYWGNPVRCPGCGIILDLEGADPPISPVPPSQYPGLSYSKHRIPSVDTNPHAQREREQWKREREAIERALEKASRVSGHQCEFVEERGGSHTVVQDQKAPGGVRKVQILGRIIDQQNQDTWRVLWDPKTDAGWLRPMCPNELEPL